MLSRFSPQALPRIVAVVMTVIVLLVMMAPAVFADGYSYFLQGFEMDYFQNEQIYFELINVSLDAVMQNGFFAIYEDGEFLETFDLKYNYYTDDILVSDSVVELVYFGNGSMVYQGLPNTEENFCIAFCFYDETFALDCGAPCGLFFVSKVSLTGYSCDFYLPELKSPLGAEAAAFLGYVTSTLSAVVSWFGILVSSLLAADGALSVLLPFVAIVLAIGLVYGGIRLIRQFVPGF